MGYTGGGMSQSLVMRQSVVQLSTVIISVYVLERETGPCHTKQKAVHWSL